MRPGILGKKIGMTHVFRPDGQAVPVTLLKAGPCLVVELITPVAMDKGLRFAIREGGRTVGAGTVTEIVE